MCAGTTFDIEVAFLHRKCKKTKSIDQIFKACKAAHEAVLDMGVNRVLLNITIDHRLPGCKGLYEKVEAIKSKL